MAPKRELTTVSLYIKYILFAANFIYFVTGCVILGVCVWIFVERNFISAMVDDRLMTVSNLLLVACGSVIVLVSFVGCCGALMEQRCLLLTYFVLLLTTFLTMLVAGVLAAVFSTKMNNNMRNEMDIILKNHYGVKLNISAYNRYVTQGWDHAQEYLDCCSVNEHGWDAYRGSLWFSQQKGTIYGHDKPYVPESCCMKDQYGDFINKEMCQFNVNGPPNGKCTTPKGKCNPALHDRGCFQAGKDFVKEYTGYIAGLGFGVAIAMIFGMGCSLYLYQKLRYHDHHRIPTRPY